MSYVHNFILTLCFILVTAHLSNAVAAETLKPAGNTVCYSGDSLSEENLKAYESCVTAYENSSADVLKICTSAAEKYRNPEIYMILAKIYAEGQIMAPNFSRHIGMLKKASDLNLAKADAELADIILGTYLQQENKNISTGLKGLAHLKKAASCGNEKALFRMAEISLHEEFKDLDVYDYSGGNEKLKELLLEDNAPAMLYAAIWLEDNFRDPEDASGQLQAKGKQNERQAVFFDYILGEYAENSAYPRILLEKAAEKGLEKAYAALAESCRDTGDKKLRLRCLSYAEAYARCRNLKAYPVKNRMLEALSDSPEDIKRALNEGRDIRNVRGCR